MKKSHVNASFILSIVAKVKEANQLQFGAANNSTL